MVGWGGGGMVLLIGYYCCHLVGRGLGWEGAGVGDDRVGRGITSPGLAGVTKWPRDVII